MLARLLIDDVSLMRVQLSIFTKIGFVLALMSLFGQQVALSQVTQGAVPDTVCDNIAQCPTSLQGWVQTQCIVNQTIFADQLAPSAAYFLDGVVANGSEVQLSTYDGRNASLAVIFSQEVKLPATSAMPNCDQLASSIVVGRLKGPSGSLPIFGLAFDEAGYGRASNRVLSICSTTDEETLGEYATMVRTLASEVRVLSLVTLQSKPLSQTHLLASQLTASDADLSQMLTMSASLESGNGAAAEADAD